MLFFWYKFRICYDGFLESLIVVNKYDYKVEVVKCVFWGVDGEFRNLIVVYLDEIGGDDRCKVVGCGNFVLGFDMV